MARYSVKKYERREVDERARVRKLQRARIKA